MFLFDLIKLVIMFRSFKIIYVIYNITLKMAYFSFYYNKYVNAQNTLYLTQSF